MQLGEMFINLGIKGSDKAIKATQEVKSSIADVTSNGLAAKAAIVGMVYELEQLMSASIKVGDSLTTFNKETGMSAQMLQHWQYAGRQFMVGADDIQNTFVGLQSTITKMSTGTIPAGTGIISNALGIDISQIKDAETMMKALRQYALTEKNTGWANEALKSFGLNGKMIAAMRANAFSDQNLNKGELYSDSQLLQNQKIGVAWSNMFDHIEKGIGKLNAKHGLNLVKDLSMVSDQLVRLLDLLTTVVEKTAALQLIGKVFEGWALILKSINGDIAGFNKDVDTAKPVDKKGTSYNPSTWIDRLKTLHSGSLIPTTTGNLAPADKTINQTVNVTNHMHGVKDNKDGADHMAKGAARVGRSLKLQGQAN